MRNRYLDLLRAVAIVRVVVYHVTGLSLLTVVIPAMPVMFALAGSLMAASLDRGSGTLGLAAVGRRLRRLLPSLWVLTAVFVPAMMLTGLAWEPKILLWLLPLQDPPANEWGAQALSANWYLRDFLWFVLLSPTARWFFRRAPWPTLAVPYLMLLAAEFGGWQPHVIVRDVGLYFGAWLLGFAHHDGLLRRLRPRRLLAIAGGLAVAGLSWALTHPGPRGHDLNDIHLGNALWAGAFILVALGFAPEAEARLRLSARWDRVVTVLNARALTIYLWHVPIIVGVTHYAENRGWPVLGVAGNTWRLAVVAALVAVAVAVAGWVEDLAGRRRPSLLPGDRRAATIPASQAVRASMPTPSPDNLVSPADSALAELAAGSVPGRAPVSPAPVSPVPGNPIPVSPAPALPGTMPPDPFPDAPMPDLPIPVSPASVPISAVPISAVPISAVPISAVPISAVPISPVPMPSTEPLHPAAAAPEPPRLALSALVDLADARPAESARGRARRTGARRRTSST